MKMDSINTISPTRQMILLKTDVTHATKLCDKGLHVKVASVTGRFARCVMVRGTVARLVFGIESCSILCDFDARHSRRCDIGLTATNSINAGQSDADIRPKCQ